MREDTLKVKGLRYLLLTFLFWLITPPAMADLGLYRLMPDGMLEVKSFGFHFGRQEGKLPSITVQKPFYYGQAEALEVGLMLTPELGLAIVNRSDLPQTPTVIGLPSQGAQLDEAWSNTPGLFFQYRNGISHFYRLKIHADHTFSGTNLEDDRERITGCWHKAPQQAHYDVLLNQPANACATFNPERTPLSPDYARVMIAKNGQYFVLDYADGSGFGLGVLQQPLPAPAYPQHFKVLALDHPRWQASLLFSRPILFDLVLVPDGNAIQTPLTCQRQNGSFSCTLTQQHEGYQFYLNRFCASARRLEEVPGMVCVIHKPSNRRFNLLPTPAISAFVGGSIGADNFIMGGRSTVMTLPETHPYVEAASSRKHD